MAIKVVPKDEMVNAIGTKFDPPSDWIVVTRIASTLSPTAPRTTSSSTSTQEAAKTPFGGTVAHGFLTLSLLSKLAEGNGVIPENIVMGLNYGFDKVRFLAPVSAGKRVRAHAEMASVDRKDDNRLLIKQSISVEIEGEDTPALVAEWLTMVVAA